MSPVFHSQFSEQVLCQPLLKFSNFDLMSIPDNMSNQPVLFRANSPVKDSDGTWYRKAKISGPVFAKKTLVTSKSKQKSAAPNTDGIRDSLFHFNCRCSMCKDFDLAKVDTKVSNSSYAEVVSSSAKTVKTDLNRKDKDLQSWKSNAQKTEKVSSAKAEFYKEEIALKGGGRADTMSQIFTDTIQVGKSQGYGESPYSTIKESIVEILTRL